MKKLCLVIFLFFVLPLNAFAKTGISFVYINGSNIYNPRINEWYKKGIQKFHPYMKTAFERDHMTQKYFLNDGKYFIEKNPVTFFWGDKNYKDSDYAEKNLTIAKGFSSKLACKIRLTANNVLHDVVWINDSNNVNFVLDDLQKTVNAEAKKGNKVVLFGYSSGSLVAYNYLLMRTPYINVMDFFNSADVSKEERDFVFQHPMKNTCRSAIGRELASFSVDGHFIFNNDFNLFKKNYMNLNEQTDAVCSPDNMIGVINIASPVVLFYSDLSDPYFKLTYYNRLLYKYILENNMFWLTVNYREDPLSFPCRENLTTEEIKSITNLNIEPQAGFIYDQSNTKGGVLAITHLYYLSTRKALSKSIVKAYVDGYKHQYGETSKQKILSKNKNSFNIKP